MNTNHAKAIKGMSIANIVLAALGIFGMLIAWAGLGVGGAAISGSGYDYFYTDDGLYFTTDDVSVLLGMLPADHRTVGNITLQPQFLDAARAAGL